MSSRLYQHSVTVNATVTGVKHFVMKHGQLRMCKDSYLTNGAGSDSYSVSTLTYTIWQHLCAGNVKGAPCAPFSEQIPLTPFSGSISNTLLDCTNSSISIATLPYHQLASDMHHTDHNSTQLVTPYSTVVRNHNSLSGGQAQKRIVTCTWLCTRCAA